MDKFEATHHLDGLLAFPVTPFDQDLQVDCEQLRRNIRGLANLGISAVFAACGTGEFSALAPDEYRMVISACKDAVGDTLPVYGGIGHGLALAELFIREAETAGADGLLALPTALRGVSEEGLIAYFESLTTKTTLPLLLYQRDGVVFSREAFRRLSAIRTIVGLKDGEGDIEHLLALRAVASDRDMVFLNGMPMAEGHASAYTVQGLTSGYSSAILNFIPEVAIEFSRKLREGEYSACREIWTRAIAPLAEIRRRKPGYAVSLIKAGARLRGLPVGTVRPPLTELTSSEVTELRRVLDRLGLASELKW
jgi:5-dehydro-4-deoxyglucarate dehydratase